MRAKGRLSPWFPDHLLRLIDKVFGVITIVFDGRREWGHPEEQDWRPYAEILVTARHSGRSERLWALIDSGADELTLHTDVASKLGISCFHLPSIPCQTAGGEIQVYECEDIDLTFMGSTASVKCFFGDNQTPLLGRRAILAHIELGLDLQGWLYKL
jgi:hypothetical protein